MRLTPPTKASFWSAVVFACCGTASLPELLLSTVFFGISTAILLAAAMFTDT